MGLVKVNVDAGFKLNQKKSSSGVIIHDETGNILGACSRITYPVLSAFAADAIAVNHGLHFARDLGFLSIIIEGDSRSVFTKINTEEDDLSEISALTWSAKEFAKNFQLCRFNFIGR